jgi:hypothetical protein
VKDLLLQFTPNLSLLIDDAKRKYQNPVDEKLHRTRQIKFRKFRFMDDADGSEATASGNSVPIKASSMKALLAEISELQ